MGERYLIDSNALIDYLAGLLPPGGLTLIDTIFDSGEINISVITQIEVLAYQAPITYLERVQNLISVAKVIPLADSLLVNSAIAIRRENRIKLPDAVIAATALIHNLILVSRNEKDFSRVAGLKYINPHSYEITL